MNSLDAAINSLIQSRIVDECSSLKVFGKLMARYSGVKGCTGNCAKSVYKRTCPVAFSFLPLPLRGCN